MNKRIYIYIYICVHICNHMDSHIYLHEGIYICKYIHPSIHPSIHACIHACMHTSIHPYIHAYIHTSMYIYIHICIHMCLFCVFSGWFITGLQIWCPHWQKISRSAAQILFLKIFSSLFGGEIPMKPHDFDEIGRLRCQAAWSGGTCLCATTNHNGCALKWGTPQE